MSLQIYSNLEIGTSQGSLLLFFSSLSVSCNSHHFMQMDVFSVCSAPLTNVKATSPLLFSKGQCFDGLEMNLHILQVEVTI